MVREIKNGMKNHQTANDMDKPSQIAGGQEIRVEIKPKGSTPAKKQGSELWHPMTALAIYHAYERWWADNEKNAVSAYEIAENMYPGKGACFDWLYDVLKFHPKNGRWKTEPGFPFTGTHAVGNGAEVQNGVFKVGRYRSNQYPGYLWMGKFAAIKNAAEGYNLLGKALLAIVPASDGLRLGKADVMTFAKSINLLSNLDQMEMVQILTGDKGEDAVLSSAVHEKVSFINGLDALSLHYLRFLFRREKTEEPICTAPYQNDLRGQKEAEPIKLQRSLNPQPEALSTPVELVSCELPPPPHLIIAICRVLTSGLKPVLRHWKKVVWLLGILITLGCFSASQHDDNTFVLRTEGLSAWISYLASAGDKSDRHRYLAGYALFRKGEYRDAYEVLSHLIVDSPEGKTKADARYILAQVALNMGHVYEAMGLISHAVQFYESKYLWESSYQSVLVQSSIEDNGKFSDAESSLSEALRYAEYDKGKRIKHWGLWHQFEYQHLLRKKAFLIAEKAARKALDLFRDNNDEDSAMTAQVSLAFASILNGDFEDSTRLLREAEAWFEKSGDYRLLRFCDVVWVAIEGPDSESKTRIESWLSTMGNDPELRFQLELALGISKQELKHERNQ